MPNTAPHPTYVSTSNIAKVIQEVKTAVEDFPAAVGKAIGRNAQLVLKEAIVQIDALIYSQPAHGSYQRTKNLRRANKIKKLGDFAWLVYNDANYAGYVHDGTSQEVGRPWMGNAIDLKSSEMEENLLNGGLVAWRVGGETTQQDAGAQDTATQDDSGQGAE